MGARSEAEAFLRLNGTQWRSELKRSQQDLKNFSAGAVRFLKRVAVAAVAVATAAGLIGTSFEQQAANIRAVSGASVQDMAKIETAARRMGETTVFSAKQSLEAEENLIRTGRTVRETIEALPSVLALAAAGQKDMAFSSELLTSTLAQFDRSTDQAADTVNVLFAATTKTRLNLDRLAEGMANAGAIAGTYGFEIQESVSALGMLVDAGLQASQAGTYLRSVYMELVARAKEMRGSLGEVLAEWDPASEGLVGALQRIEEAGISATDASLELGRKGGPGLAILLQRGSAALAEMRDAVTGTNAAFDAQAIQMDTNQSRIKELMSVLQEAALRIYDTFKVQLGEALASLTKFIRANYENIQRTAEQVVAGIEDVVGAIRDIAEFVIEYKGAIIGLTAAIVAYRSAILLAKTAQIAFNAAMASSGVGLLIIGIASLATWLGLVIDKYHGVKGALSELVMRAEEEWIRFRRDLKLVWALIKHVLGAIDAIGDTVSIALDYARRAIVTFVDAAGDAFELLGEAITHPWRAGKIAAKMKEGMNAAIDTMVSIVEDGRIKTIWSDLSAGYREEKAAIIAETLDMLAQVRAAREATKEGAAAGVGAGGFVGPTISPEELQQRNLLALTEEVELRKRELKQETLDEMMRLDQEELDSSNTLRETQMLLAQETMRRMATYASTAYGVMQQEALRTANLEQGLRVKVARMFIKSAAAAAAAAINAEGQKATVRAAFELAEAVAAAARYDFGAAGKHALAAAKFAAIGGVAAIGAAVVGSIGTKAESTLKAEPLTAETGTSGSAAASGARSLSISSRQAPETVNITIATTIQGNVIGDTGFDEMVDRYVVPRLRELVAGEAF